MFRAWIGEAPAAPATPETIGYARG
jgi:hypothetical protein